MFHMIVLFLLNRCNSVELMLKLFKLSSIRKSIKDIFINGVM